MATDFTKTTTENVYDFLKRAAEDDDFRDTLATAQPDVCGLRLYMEAHNARARQAYERLGLKQTDYQVFEMDFVLKG